MKREAIINKIKLKAREVFGGDTEAFTSFGIYPKVYVGTIGEKHENWGGVEGKAFCLADRRLTPTMNPSALSVYLDGVIAGMKLGK